MRGIAIAFYIAAAWASIDSLFEPNRSVATVEVFCADIYLIAALYAETVWQATSSRARRR